MNQTALLAPLFVQIALTFALLLWTGQARTGALRARQLKIRDIALGQNAWPDRPTQIARAYQNQLEVPVLFYVLVAFLLLTKQESALFVALAWLFVALRVVHAAIHVTTNNVLHRFAAFLAGVVVLMAMWAVFAFRIIVGA